MSVLAPLYLLGALAVTLPVLFHLIRRTPRGRQPFSSLMFLVSSPPRITRRSRIEHWLLLLLRAAALILLALAFARPFLRESANLLLDKGVGRRVAIVVDTSASMRRGNLWQTAVARTNRVMAQLAPQDEVGLFAFDEQLRKVVDWDEPIRDPEARIARVKQGLAELSPTWARSNIGQALVSVADQMISAKDSASHDRVRQIILISDLQEGAEYTALQGFEWPTQVRLAVEQIRPSVQNNAGISLMADDEQPGWRVRVSNSEGSTSEQFQVGWHLASVKDRAASPLSIHVPAGSSRVVNLPAPPSGVDGIQLQGDADEFDNLCYFSPRVLRELQVVFVGDDAADDPQGLRYFLERVWAETTLRKVHFTARPRGESLEFSGLPPQLTVVACPLNPTDVPRLQKYLQAGGMALFVAGDKETAASLVGIAPGISLSESESSDAEPAKARSSQYALFGKINFDHPVFATLAGARYNDFTRVRIWKHQRFKIEDAVQANVLASFDNGDPAVWEHSMGSGKVVWFACGWRPNDSQLALSSKFVPILSGLLDHLVGIERVDSHGLRVHESIAIPSASDRNPGTMMKPDGSAVEIAADAGKFTETDQPGIYRWQHGGATVNFAVNLHPSESDTAPMSIEQFEQFGVRVGHEPTAAEQAERQRQMRDIELESRQKLWRWLLIAVLGILAVETVLASRSSLITTEHPDPTPADLASVQQ